MVGGRYASQTLQQGETVGCWYWLWPKNLVFFDNKEMIRADVMFYDYFLLTLLGTQGEWGQMGKEQKLPHFISFIYAARRYGPDLRWIFLLQKIWIKVAPFLFKWFNLKNLSQCYLHAWDLLISTCGKAIYRFNSLVSMIW